MLGSQGGSPTQPSKCLGDHVSFVPCARAQSIITPVRYNDFMRTLVLACLALCVACAPAAVPGTPSASRLLPYATSVPTATPPAPTGLFEPPQGALPSPTPITYTIKAGDTLGQIAEQFHVDLDALLAANPDVDPNGMSVGTQLKVPANPTNSIGDATPTPSPFAVQRISCHPTADRGLWCFVLAHNDSPDLMEDLAAQVTLLDDQGNTVASQTALLPLNILPSNMSLPLSVFFPPDVPATVHPQVKILTAIRLLPSDQRYLPATVQNSVVEVDWTGRSAQVRGLVVLPADAKPAGTIWVAAVIYDAAGDVVGMRRWESSSGLAAGASLPFSFSVSSLAGQISDVQFAVEARP
jgi:LysM repeat protein